MQLLEHQAKQLLKLSGLPIPEGTLVSRTVYLPPVSFPVVVKSQVPVGGRGKLGGIRLVNNQQELETAVDDILQLEIKGFKPEILLVEQALKVSRELYLSVRVNRDLGRAEYIASSKGGTDIESHASSAVVVSTDDPSRFSSLAKQLQLNEATLQPLLMKLEEAFLSNDCLLLEINPLVVTADGDLVCADAKVQVDDNARFRQTDLPWKDEPSIKPLGGNIGVIANGAGMAMSTMDTIYSAGGKPANFLDIGGGTGEDVFVNNLREITQLPNITSIIINIFAGITRCDDIARGIIVAKKQIPDLVPLFIRLEGTNKEEARRLLDEANVTLQPDLKTCIDLAMKLQDQQATVRQVAQDTTTISFSEDSASSAERGDTKSQLKPSEPEEKDSSRVSNTLLGNRPVIVQGITGHHGAFHTRGMLDAGTNIVAGVTPGKAGETVHGISVYNTVADALQSNHADASVLFVPARFAKDAMLEALEAGILLIVCITEGIPVHDMLIVRAKATALRATIIGPNCPGLVVPGSHKLGIIAEHITTPGATTIISRSGTLTYELADALTKKGVGQRLIVGIGGDPVQGMNFVEALELAERDTGTKQIVMVGEIGGQSEQMAGDFFENYVKKPVYGLVVGHSLPAGQTFGHAGAIVGSADETATAKTAYLTKKGLNMSVTLDELISKL